MIKIYFNGKAYWALRPLEMQSDFDGFRITNGSFRAINVCDNCGRFDTEPIVARSIAEAIELGWLVETDDA